MTSIENGACFFLLWKENDWYSWSIFKKLLFYVIKYNIKIIIIIA